MPIPGLEDLLHLLFYWQSEAKAAGGWEPRLACPFLTQHCPCNVSSAHGAPSLGAGSCPEKAGLGWPQQAL